MFVRYHLPDHATAARLGLGLRQFYREQDRGLLALRRPLMMFEDQATQMGE
ncbi:MAG TPA: hypothetical protein VF458_16710 [Ktedonobacteraceae bacterium]